MRSLIAAVLKTGSGSMATLLFGMASVKIVALVLGPSGVGLLSLIKQTVLTLAAVGYGGQTALVQGIASKENTERDMYVRTTFWLFVCGSILTVVLIEMFAPLIAGLLFGKGDAESTRLIRWIAVPVVLWNTYIYLKSLLNGFRAIGKLALVENAGPFLLLLSVYPVCISVGNGYALAFVWMLSASQAVMIVIAINLARNNGWLLPIYDLHSPAIDKAASLHFFRFAGTTFATTLLTTCTVLAVRAMVTRHGGLHDAGLFDLAWALSGSYVMILLGAFGTYYMPALSGTSEPAERIILIKQVIRLSTLVMVPMITGVITMKPLVVKLLYSSEFLPALELVRWMLIGDYLKIMTWLLATTVLANADMRVYFWAELFWNVGFALLAGLSIFAFGQLQGIGIAFIALHLCINVYYLRYVHTVYKLRLTSDLALPWVIGLVVVGLASWQTWDDRIVNWRISTFWIIVSFFFVWLTLKRNERRNLLKAISTARSDV